MCAVGGAVRVSKYKIATLATWVAVQMDKHALAVSAVTRLRVILPALDLRTADAVCQGSSAVVLAVRSTSVSERQPCTNEQQASLLAPPSLTCSRRRLRGPRHHQQRQSRLPRLKQPPQHPRLLPTQARHQRHLHRGPHPPTPAQQAGFRAPSALAAVAVRTAVNAQQAHLALETRPAVLRHLRHL